MDRRSVIGFVLIFLIIIGYPILMNKINPPRPRVEVAEAPAPQGGSVPADTASSPTRDAAFALPPATLDGALSSLAPLTVEEALMPVAPAGTQGVVSIETPLYRARIDTRGGTVSSWEILAHKSWTGDPVQLVPATGPAGGLDAVLFRAMKMDLGVFPYECDVDQLRVGAGGGTRSLTMRGITRGGLEVRKIFTFNPDTYGVTVDIELGGDSAAIGGLLAQAGTPDEIRFGWNRGIAPTEHQQRMEQATLRALAGVGEDQHARKRDGLKKNVEKVEGQWRGSIRYAGLQDRYFTIMGIVPREQGEPVEGTVRLSGDKETMAQSWAIDLPARRTGGGIASARLELYIGPQQADLLKAYGQGLENTMDLGWKWVRPLSKFVLWGMELLYRYIPNYGVIIIIFSVLTKLMFYPLTRTSTQSMKKMQDLQPKLKALQEKFKGDKEKLNQATMKLYQEEKVNPLAGCLPLLVQSPVFIALYQALNHTISLRGQPFFAWMQDLSQPDAIATLPFAIPFLGADLNLLPVLMGIATYFQTKFTPSAGGPQMAMMNTMMPVLMVFIFYNMPSGLVLYWFVNNVMQAYQSWRIHATAGKSGGVVKA